MPSKTYGILKLSCAQIESLGLVFKCTRNASSLVSFFIRARGLRVQCKVSLLARVPREHLQNTALKDLEA